jgi:hypothetical protein
MFYWKKKSISYYFLLLTLYIFAIHPSALAGFEDRRFEDVRLKLAESIISSLVSSGECLDANDCQKKLILFASPRSGGVGIQIWGVNKKNITQSISSICASTFVDQPELEVISIDFYSIRKQDSLSLPFWKSVKPSVEVIFKRKNNAER